MPTSHVQLHPAATPTPPPTPPRDRAALARRDVAATGAVTLALGWWATYLQWGTGGREPQVLSIALLLLGLAAVLVAPWRRLPVGVLTLGTSVGAGAWLVVLTAPTGLAGAHEAASYTYAGLLGLVVLGWATTPARRTTVVVAVLGAAGAQFTQGWLAWWGRQEATATFQGTYYWHNQAGIFLAAGAVIGFALVASGRRPLAPLGWVVGPLCAAGVVFTTSRGSQLGLVLGVVALVVLAVVRRSPTGVARLLGVSTLSAFVATVLTGPPFFTERVAVTASTAARSESFVGNGVQRFEDWRRAWAIFSEWPLSGAGFYSFDSATEAVTTKRDGVSTAFAHNGFLQAAADGGLVLVVPLVVALGVLLLAGLRALPTALAQGDAVQPAALVTYVVLLLHSGMDFDWTYPGLLSLTALMGALQATRAPSAHAPVGPGPHVPASPGHPGRLVPLAGLVLLVASVVGARGGGLQLNVPIGL
jgi:O-antigen ligase